MQLAAHKSKFVSGGVQKKEENVLFTEAGLHPGSPRFAAAQHEGGDGGGAQVQALMQQAQQQQIPSRPDDAGRDDFVYAQVGCVWWLRVPAVRVGNRRRCGLVAPLT